MKTISCIILCFVLIGNCLLDCQAATSEHENLNAQIEKCNLSPTDGEAERSDINRVEDPPWMERTSAATNEESRNPIAGTL